MSRYEKDKLIGSGTYGNVWLVKSKANKLPYVMKEIKLTSMNATEKQQALSEVLILSKCKHNNIIGYKDATVDHNKGALIIVMEYAEGGDLYSAILKQRGVPFAEPLILSWFVQTCLALQYIHYQNILHRDLKSQNVFITRNKIIKLGDFGISRLLREPTELAKTAIGTPYYLSPEICLRKPYNHKSDIWALGCVLFEMAALAHPFQASNFPDLVALILKGKRKELPKQCSRLIEELVQIMLNPRPENRPTTDEILALSALQPYLSEYWHNSKMHGMLSEPAVERVRRLSLSSSYKKAEATTIKRRASLSSASSKIPKFKSPAKKERETLKFKSALSSRSHAGKKVHKPSPLADVGKTEKERKMTYRILSSKRLGYVLGSRSPSSVDSRILRKIGNSSRNGSPKCKPLKTDSPIPNESDCGYQSSETFKTISGKIEIKCDKGTSQKFLPAGLYTSVSSVIAKSDITMRNNGFRVDTPIKDLQSETENIASYKHCNHCFQCPQCMLDMLWKNRIRGQDGAMVDSNERSKFAIKLKSIFSGDLFHIVYEAFVSHWDGNESGISHISLQNIMNSLNYSQVQHLPLMMQLIQLDKILNFEQSE